MRIQYLIFSDDGRFLEIAHNYTTETPISNIDAMHVILSSPFPYYVLPNSSSTFPVKHGGRGLKLPADEASQLQDKAEMSHLISQHATESASPTTVSAPYRASWC